MLLLLLRRPERPAGVFLPTKIDIKHWKILMYVCFRERERVCVNVRDGLGAVGGDMSHAICHIYHDSAACK